VYGRRLHSSVRLIGGRPERIAFVSRLHPRLQFSADPRRVALETTSGLERLCSADLLQAVSESRGTGSNCASSAAARTSAVGLVGGRECSGDGSRHHGFGAHGGARGAVDRQRSKAKEV
jgi:hypothetical protein